MLPIKPLENLLQRNGWIHIYRALKENIRKNNSLIPEFVYYTLIHNSLQDQDLVEEYHEYTKENRWSIYFLITGHKIIYYLFCDRARNIIMWNGSGRKPQGIRYVNLEEFIQRIKRLNENYSLFE